MTVSSGRKKSHNRKVGHAKLTNFDGKFFHSSSSVLLWRLVTLDPRRRRQIISTTRQMSFLVALPFSEFKIAHYSFSSHMKKLRVSD